MVSLLTTKQVADRLDVTVRRVHTLIGRGDLVPAIKLDGPRGAYLFHPAEVDRFAATLDEVAS